MKAPRAEPLYFGPDDRPLFGWLHRAAAPATNLGLVICNPFGHEAQNCHQSLRHCAESAADAGISTLRFDFDGTGDSSGSDQDENRLASWINSIQRAVETLQAATGVNQMALLGVRLGALLATMAAIENPEIGFLALMAPAISGRSWLREMRALHGALGLEETPADVTPLPEGAHEAMGFMLSETTQQSLAGVDLLKLEKAPAEHILLLDRDDLPGGEKLARHFKELGAAVEHRAVPGYADMMRDPHEAQVPVPLIDATVNWLSSQVTRGPSLAVHFEKNISASINEMVQEHAVFLDEDRQLFGIVSAPHHAPAHKAILLLNSGANHRTGPNRLYVTLARHLAQRGVLVLRMDIAGLGDSAPHEGEEEQIVYAPRVTDDINTALRYVREKWSVSECHAAGLCSGGYHAFKAALAGAPLDGIILINPLTFNWQPGDSLETPDSQLIAETQRYKQSMLQAGKWKKLLTGQTNARVVAQVVAQRAAGVAERRIRNVAQRVGFRRRDDLGAALETLAGRRVMLHFIFSERDPGLALLHEQGGAAVTRLLESRQFNIQRIASADHTFTPLWSHWRLLEAFDKAIK